MRRWKRAKAGAVTTGIVSVVAGGAIWIATGGFGFGSQAVTLTVSGSDPRSGSVTLAVKAPADTNTVDFRVDGTSVGTDSTKPYSISWDSDTVDDGTHSVTALATGDHGSGLDGVTIETSNGNSPAAQTANLWVDPDGGTCTRSASAVEYDDAAACGTLAAALGAKTVGDLILVASGDYPAETVTYSSADNTAATVTTIRAETALGPHFSGLSNLKRSYVTYDGLDFDDVQGNNNSSSNIVNHVTYQNGHLGSASMSNSKNISILDNDIGSNLITARLNDCLDFLKSISAAEPTNILIEGNYFHDCQKNSPTAHSDAIQFSSGTDITIRGNTIVRVESNPFFIKGDATCSGGISCGDLVRFTFENNIVNCPGTSSGSCSSTAQAGQLTGSVACQDCLVRNNLFIGATPTINAQGNIAGDESYFYGNIILANPGSGSDPNTDCYSSTVEHTDNGTQGGWTWDYNITLTTTCGSHASTVANAAALLFTNYLVNEDAADYHIGALSPAIDAGNPSSYPTTDKDGVSRFLGSAPDAGPYEKG